METMPNPIIHPGSVDVKLVTIDRLVCGEDLSYFRRKAFEEDVAGNLEEDVWNEEHR